MALTNKLSAIGDAIREKTGKSEKLTLDAMVTEIGSITTGGGEIEPIVLSGFQAYGCSGGLAAAYMELYGNTITTKDITNSTYLFFKSPIERIPFVINMATTGVHEMTQMFADCTALTELPMTYNAKPNSMATLFQNCCRLRNIPDNYFTNWDFSQILGSVYSGINGIFAMCYSLRNVPSSLYSGLSTPVTTSPYSSIYYNSFSDCYALDEVTGISVNSGVLTSNAFMNTFKNCNRLQRFTFATNEDGTPKVARWKAQVIDLSSNVGYASNTQLLNYNSGITADKEVTNKETYNALKNDADWFTRDKEYSRYNHDSAVETINSLPDTSAYLAANGGTNTIKFRTTAGKYTDGGAIQNISSEEEVGVVVAAATAKGWTVAWVT